MHGDGKSDRLIVAEKRSNNGCGAPQLAKSVEPSGLTKGNLFWQTKHLDTAPGRESIWTTLNGHAARNRGYSQEVVPTSILSACKLRWNGYGRRMPARQHPR
jgi:hypothetical protein